MANFADLLKKIAANARLTPQELDELGRFGTETQQRNALISGSFQNIETLNVKNLKAVSVESDFISSLGCRVLSRNSQSIINASGVVVVFDAEIYDDDSMVNLSTNNDRVTINTSGRWLLVAGCSWSDTGTDFRQLGITIYNQDGTTAGSGGGSYSVRGNGVVDLLYLKKGQYLRYIVRQDSGSSKDLSQAKATLVLMRKTDTGDD